MYYQPFQALDGVCYSCYGLGSLECSNEMTQCEYCNCLLDRDGLCFGCNAPKGICSCYCCLNAHKEMIPEQREKLKQRIANLVIHYDMQYPNEDEVAEEILRIIEKRKEDQGLNQCDRCKSERVTTEDYEPEYDFASYLCLDCGHVMYGGIRVEG